MPIYEYKCNRCRHVFETLFASLKEERQVVCPACQSRKTKRLMSTFGGKFGTTSSGSGCTSCSTTSCPPSWKSWAKAAVCRS